MTNRPPKQRVYGNGKLVTWWRELLYPFRLALRSPRSIGSPTKFCRYCGRPNPTGEA